MGLLLIQKDQYQSKWKYQAYPVFHLSGSVRQLPVHVKPTVTACSVHVIAWKWEIIVFAGGHNANSGQSECVQGRAAQNSVFITAVVYVETYTMDYSRLSCSLLIDRLSYL